MQFHDRPVVGTIRFSATRVVRLATGTNRGGHWIGEEGGAHRAADHPAEILRHAMELSRAGPK